MPNNRTSLITGLSLIFLGIVFLAAYFIPQIWPGLLVALGALMLVAALLWRNSGLVISGMVNLTLGGILVYQTITQDWKSWYYLWPLIFAAIGAGMLLMGLLERYNAALRGGRYLRVGWAFLALGLAAAGGLAYFRALIDWPVIIWGMGAVFLLAALISGVGPLAVPGAILGGLGALLNWQLVNHAWASWSYAWALLPAFVGVGLFLGFLRSRVMRIVGLSMLSWSLVIFVLFGLLFAGNGGLFRFWPFALILAGLMVLVQSFLTRRPHTGE